MAQLGRLVLKSFLKFRMSVSKIAQLLMPNQSKTAHENAPHPIMIRISLHELTRATNLISICQFLLALSQLYVAGIGGRPDQPLAQPLFEIADFSPQFLVVSFQREFFGLESFSFSPFSGVFRLKSLQLEK